MDKFGRQFYEDIWGTVHRHEYCELLADRLVEQYGRVSMLDIGTCCGKLVQELRRRDCDAWGLEISDYALENTCAPECVRKGSVLDIPFKDDRFEIVYSNGLWEYVKREDISTAWKECLRVGYLQDHNIDTTAGAWMQDFETYESPEWWEKQLKYPRVLIACPTHECKEYAFERWIRSAKALEWPSKEYLVVDNSATERFFETWKDKIRLVHLNDMGDLPADLRIARSMEYIRGYFLQSGCDFWFNLESDILVPPNALRILMGLGNYDWREHAYPCRVNKDAPPVFNGFGCNVFSRRLMESNDFVDAPADTTTDGWFWKKVSEQFDRAPYRVIETYNLMGVQHVGQSA